jgi:hypothetical protein
MMMTKDEALRLALKTIERSVATCFDQYAHEEVMSRPEHFVNQTITAIKAALEAKDEPWLPVSIGVDVTKEGAHVVGIYALDNDTSQIFYAKYHYAKDPQASQRKWVGLTDEEIWETISRIGTSDSDVNPYAKLSDARAIEAKLKEKNTC